MVGHKGSAALYSLGGCAALWKMFLWQGWRFIPGQEGKLLLAASVKTGCRARKLEWGLAMPKPFLGMAL